MAPPVYADLGKNARDTFSKGFHFGNVKLEAKTCSTSGVNFTAGYNHSIASSKVLGNLETKYKCNDYGLTITEKWNTDNTLSSDITLEDKLCRGLKLTLDSKIALETDKKSALLKACYKHDLCSVNADVNLVAGGPLINAAAVLGHQGWLAGYQMSFDTNTSKLTRSNFALGYVAADFTVHSSIDDGRTFGASVHRRVARDLEAAVDLGWTSGTNVTKFALGAKYSLDNDSVLRAKVNNNSEIGLGFQQKLRKGVTMTLSTLIDAKNFNQGSHKLGLCVELQT